MVRAAGVAGVPRAAIAVGSDGVARSQSGSAARVGEGVVLDPGGAGGEAGGGGLGVGLRGGDDGEEAAVADDLRVARERAVAQCGEAGGTGGGTDNAGVQHPRRAQVVDETPSAEELVGEVHAGSRGAGDAALGGRLRASLGRGVAVQQAGLGGGPVGAERAGGPQEGAVGDGDGLGRDAGPLRGDADEDAAGVGAGVADGAAGVLDREAAGGDALVGAVGGGGGADADAGERPRPARRRRSG